MTPTISETRSRDAWELARRQHGVLTRGDLLALGFSDEAIQHRLRRGRLHRVIPGVRCHRRPNLPAEAITKRLNIPLTQPVQTFLDLATVTGPKGLERGINEADKHDVIDPDALRGALDDHAGEPGLRPLRAILDKHTFRLSDDELERLLRPIAAAAGLPIPLTKVMVNDFEVDFFWPTSASSSRPTAGATTALLQPRPVMPCASRPTPRPD